MLEMIWLVWHLLRVVVVANGFDWTRLRMGGGDYMYLNGGGGMSRWEFCQKIYIISWIGWRMGGKEFGVDMQSASTSG